MRIKYLAAIAVLLAGIGTARADAVAFNPPRNSTILKFLTNDQPGTYQIVTDLIWFSSPGYPTSIQPSGANEIAPVDGGVYPPYSFDITIPPDFHKNSPILSISNVSYSPVSAYPGIKGVSFSSENSIGGNFLMDYILNQDDGVGFIPTLIDGNHVYGKFKYYYDSYGDPPGDFSGVGDITITRVPEPGSLALLGTAAVMLAGAAGLIRRRPSL